jgi:hypothetical protein
MLEGFINIYHICLRPDTHKVALHEHVHAIESVSRICLWDRKVVRKNFVEATWNTHCNGQHILLSLCFWGKSSYNLLKMRWYDMSFRNSGILVTIAANAHEVLLRLYFLTFWYYYWLVHKENICFFTQSVVWLCMQTRSPVFRYYGSCCRLSCVCRYVSDKLYRTHIQTVMYYFMFFAPAL